MEGNFFKLDNRGRHFIKLVDISSPWMECPSVKVFISKIKCKEIMIKDDVKIAIQGKKKC